jgi:hypothetical protein
MLRWHQPRYAISWRGLAKRESSPVRRPALPH